MPIGDGEEVLIRDVHVRGRTSNLEVGVGITNETWRRTVTMGGKEGRDQ